MRKTFLRELVSTQAIFKTLRGDRACKSSAAGRGCRSRQAAYTQQLRIPSQMVLILLMYLGRVGGLTLIYAALSSKNVGNARLPQEKITIG